MTSLSKKTTSRKIKKKEKDKLSFDYLPDYACFILDNCLDRYVVEQIKNSRKENVPLLKFFEHLTEKELLEFAKKSSRDFLTLLADNKAREYIKKSAADYVKNRIPFFEREQIVAEDITIVSFIRRKTFSKFLPLYTRSTDLFMKVMEDVDRFVTESEATSFSAYLQVQQEKISGINAVLAQREQELLEAQELAGMGSFFWDLAGGKSSYTPGVFRIFEMTKTSTLESFLEHVHEDDRKKLKEALEKSFTGDGIYECEYRFVKNNKEKKIWSRGKVSFHEGKPVNMKGTLMDVTSKYSLLEQLQAKTTQLEELNESLEFKNFELERINKELESFNYIASHDLQEPLRKIQIFTNRILEKGMDVLPTSAVEYLDKIVVSSTRMKMLIEDLLTFSQSTATEGNFEITDLNILLQDVKNTLSAVIEEKKVVIESAPLPSLNVVPFQIQQVLLNLISNAIKYSKEHTPIHIKISSDIVKGEKIKLRGPIHGKNYFELKVEDNGIGFDISYAEKIFGLFQRLHGKDKYSGTGIGLAICKKIVQNHNGFIMAESIPGEGSVFYVYLPNEIVSKANRKLVN